MESSVLSRNIEPENPKSPTLRDYVLARFEMLLTLNLSKSSLETMMQQENRERGGQTLIPTTLRQFKKLTSFLSGEIRFYAVCCVPCDGSMSTCPVCKAELFVAPNSKRPKCIMFVRSVKAWLIELLRVPDLAAAVRRTQRRAGRDGVIADIWDGKVVKELAAGGTECILLAHSLALRPYPKREGSALYCKLGWVSPLQGRIAQVDGRRNACLVEPAACAALSTRAHVCLVGRKWPPI